MFLKSLRGVFSFARRPIGVLWDGSAATAEPPAAGSTSSSGDAGAGSSGSGGQASQTGQPGSTGSGGSGAATGTPGAGGQQQQPRQFSYTEDRGRWIPPHRLVEETKKRETLELQFAEANKRIQALAGVTPVDPNTAEAEKIREAFFALPGMAHFRQLTPESVKQLLGLAQSGQVLTETARNHWDRHATATYKKLDDAVAEHLGIDALSERQAARINTAFIAMLRSDEAKYRQRYEDGDETLITEFVKEFVDDFFEPVRRSATAGAIPKPPRVPRGGSSAPVTQGAPQIDYNDSVAVENEAVRRLKEAGHLRER